MATKKVKEEVKPIILTDNENGDQFILEFSRETVKWAESRGFNINEVDAYPMTRVPEMFFYAFRMHHKNIDRRKTDKILFEDLGGLNHAIIERLGQLYAAPFNSLMVEDDEAETKNVKMTIEM